MYSWYKAARVCYVVLSDVGLDRSAANSTTLLQEQLSRSRWFTRGWTLQELIAPRNVRFYDRSWKHIGDKVGLVDLLSEITRIDADILTDRTHLTSASVAKRMSWASERETLRIEDQAYALLGIFDVNIPLLYGEGRKAFQRLQEEIIRTSTDHSILAWLPTTALGSASIWSDMTEESNLLAPSPYSFRDSRDIISWALPQSETFELSQRGLRMTLYASAGEWIPRKYNGTARAFKLVLNCRYAHEPSTYITLRVIERFRVDDFGVRSPQDAAQEDSLYDRDRAQERRRGTLISLDTTSLVNMFTRRTFTMARNRYIFPDHGERIHIALDIDGEATDAHKLRGWNGQTLTLDSRDDRPGLHGWLGIKIYNTSSAEGVETAEIILIVRVMCTADEYTRVPPIFVGTKSRKEVANYLDAIFALPSALGSDSAFHPDETRLLSWSGATSLAVTARYVNMAGEILWSLEIKTGPAKDELPMLGELQI